jgi:hypothetical protein
MLKFEPLEDLQSRKKSSTARFSIVGLAYYYYYYYYQGKDIVFTFIIEYIVVA